MKRIVVWLVMTMMVGLAGCAGENGMSSADSKTTGSVCLNVDLAALRQTPKTAAKSVFSTISSAAAPITAVSATLTRVGYADKVSNLTVVNNIASATISGLEQGYWHVAVMVYSGASTIYSGAVDVNIVAGAEVAAELLFDPVVAPGNTVTTGSVKLTVGLNKYPGYAKIQQYVSTILQDQAYQKFYIYDSSSKVVAVYNADTMVRESDIQLQSQPQAITVDAAGGSLLLGYSTGKIFRLKVSDQSFTQVADTLVSVNALVSISPTYLFVGSGVDWGPSNTYLTVNLNNGQTVSTKSYWYPLSNFTYNPAAGMIYGLDSGLSPADIHHIAVDAAAGTITSISDSRYHGDYGFGAPIRLLNNGTRLATASGNMFISSASAADDITFVGNLGHPLIDMVSDDALGNLYLFNSDNINKLLVIKQDTYFVSMTLDILAGPKKIFNTPSKIIVFAKPDNDYYVKVYSKTGLGLM